MQTSDAGLMALCGFEGIVLSRYKDAVGVWTIGLGHTAAADGIDPKTFTGKITVAEAINLLRVDIVQYERAVLKAVKITLTQPEFDALASLCYNIGPTNLSKSTLVRKLNAGDRKGAAAAFTSWNKAGGKILSALVDRRKAERLIFSEGKYPAPYASLYPATAAGAVQWGKGKRVDLRTELNAVPAVVPTPRPDPATKPDTVAPARPKPGYGPFWSALFAILSRIFKVK